MKKTGEGVGNVFKGVGQAAKRTADNIYIAPKKGEKKVEKKQ